MKWRGAESSFWVRTVKWSCRHAVREKERVVRLKGGSYWLVERDWPGANYPQSIDEHIPKDGTLDELLV
jgi:hypothetical protein